MTLLKRILYIIFTNLFLFVIVLFIIEFFSFLTTIFIYREEIINTKAYKYLNCWFSFNSFNRIEDNENEFRPISYGKGSQRPIVLLGCSHTYGSTLKDEETFSAQLSNYTNRTVYNFAIPAMGTSSMLYILQKDNFKSKVPDAEYFVYVYFDDHIRRNYKCVPNILYNEFSAKYNINEDKKLVLEENNKFSYFFNSLYSFRLYSEFYGINKIKQADMSLLKLLLKEMKNTISDKYPNSKFVILILNFFPQTYFNKSLEYEENEIEAFAKNNNIKTIYMKKYKCGQDLINGKYRSWDKIHPTKELWKDFIPDFVKELEK